MVARRMVEREVLSRPEAKEVRRDLMMRSPQRMALSSQPGLVAGFLMNIPILGGIFSKIYAMYEWLGLNRQIKRRQAPLQRLPRIPGSAFRPPRSRKPELAFAHARTRQRYPGYPGRMKRGVFPGGLGQLFRGRRRPHRPR